MLQADTITSTWSGATDNHWNTSGNWDQGVPQNGGGNLFNAVVTNTTNNPILFGSSVIISGLTLDTGNTLNLGGNSLTIDNGSFAISGTINGALTLNGASSGTFNGVVSSIANSSTGVVHVVADDPGYSTIGGLVNPTGGLVSVENSAILVLQAGNYSNDGTFSVVSGSLRLGPGTVNFSGSGILNVTNTVSGFNSDPATLGNGLGHTIQGSGLFSQEVTLQNAGTLSATGSMQINGQVTNTGTVQSVTGGTLTLTGPITNSGAILANGGIVNVNNNDVAGGSVTASGGGTVNFSANTIGGTVNVNDGGTVNLTGATLAGNTTVAVGGTLNVTTGFTGTLAGTFTNNDYTQVTGGTLSLQGGGSYTNNGTISVSASSTLLLSSTVTLASGNNSGILVLDSSDVSSAGGAGATLVNSAGHTIGASNTEFHSDVALNNAGTLTATGLVLVDGAVTNSGTLQATGTGNLTLSGPITNTGAILADHGTVTINNQTVSGGAVTVQNSGTLSLSGSNVGESIGFNSGGSVSLNSSTLSGVNVVASGTSVNALTGASSIVNTFTNNGTVTVASGATLDFAPNTFTNNSLVQVAGTLSLQGVAAPDSSIVVNTGTITLNNGTLAITGSGNQVTLAGSGTLSLTNNSTVSASAPFAVVTNGSTHTISGNGGTIDSSVSLTNQGTLQASGGTLTVNGSLTNTGTAKAIAGGTLNLNGSTVNFGTLLADGGTLNIGGGGMQSFNTGSVITVQNGGALGVASNIYGTVNIKDTSTGSMNGGGLFGTTNIASGASLQISSGLLAGTVNNNGSITGLAGQFNNLILNGNLNLTNNGTITLGGQTNINSFVGNGTLALAGTGSLLLQSSITASSPFTLQNNATHTIQMDGGAIGSQVALHNLGTVSVLSNSFLNGAVTNSGTIEAVGSNASSRQPPNSLINLDIRGSLDNTGGLLLADHAQVTVEGAISGATGTITAQDGVVVLTSGTYGGTVNANGFSALSSAANLSGTLNVNAGALARLYVFGNGGPLYGAATGVTTVAAGGTLYFGGATLGGTVTNNGSLIMDAQTAHLAAGTSITTSTFFQLASGGNLVLNGDATIGGSGALLLNGATISNDGTGTLTNAAGGTIAGGGTISAGFQNLGTLTTTGQVIISGNFVNLSGGVLTGGTYIVEGQLQIPGDITTNRATIQLESSGEVIDFSTANALAGLTLNDSAGTLKLVNATFDSSAATFTNDGSVIVDSASAFQATGNTYVQNSGSTKVDGVLAAATFDLEGGRLSGSGTVNADVHNDGGVIAPGDSPGTIHFSSYTQGAGGELDLEFADRTSWDQVFVSGAASLDGTLRLIFDPGFDPIAGQRFLILSAASLTGDFSRIANADFHGLRFSEVILGNNIYLEAVPEPAAWLLAGLGLGLLLLARRGVRGSLKAMPC